MNTQRIEAALQALLQRNNEDAFVIFEDKATGKFVQFAGSAEQPLLLDLPLQALDAPSGNGHRISSAPSAYPARPQPICTTNPAERWSGSR